ncbi:MAG: class I mannose-6-phosphate isomerase [Bacteroidales bacterium]|nr:class I mannose-6-phosphate isomerase [Bacteroidales bacterium]
MTNNLYPLKFIPIYKSKIWGGNKIAELFNRKNTTNQCGESWEISDFENNVSIVANGFLKGNSLSEIIEIYMGDIVGDSVFQKFGCTFPLLVKFIDAQDNLSVQVHPNDEIAYERHNSFGKTEMWYVIHADKNSHLYNGFNKDIDQNEYANSIIDGSIINVLNNPIVKKGDVFFVPAGNVHSIGKGILLAEIQQSSDITYRIFDYNRTDNNGEKRELHTDLSFDAINFKQTKDFKKSYSIIKNKSVNVTDCEYFTTNIFSFDMPIEKDFPEIDSFIIYMCTQGSCKIEYDDQKNFIDLSMGETVLIPAIIKNLCFYPNSETTLLETYIK